MPRLLSLLALALFFCVAGSALGEDNELSPAMQAKRLGLAGKRAQDENKPGEAVAAYDKLVALKQPLSNEFWYFYGLALRDVGRFPDAKSALLKYVKLTGDTGRNTEAALLMLDQLDAQIDKDKARKEAAERIAPSFKDCDVCPEMVVIPAGSFDMGSPASETGRYDNESPVHPVTLKSFALGRNEVTRGEFAAFVRESGYRTEAEQDAVKGCFASSLSASDEKMYWRANHSWRTPGFDQNDLHPVICVSWNDAQAYIKWLNGRSGARGYRLPSEAEWEYAARAGTRSSRYWGDDPDQACAYANVLDETPAPNGQTWNNTHRCKDGAFFTAAVGSYRANGFGLNDMLGNVWEWAQDCGNASYTGAPSDGSAWDAGDCSRRMSRGGAWTSDRQRGRAATRGGGMTSYRISAFGFRVARTAP